MDYDWKKQDKQFYLPKAIPSLITIPKFNFFVIDGKGNPNSEDFIQAVGVLYSLSYAVKMMPKKGTVPTGYFDYKIFPLEGVWDLAEEARGLEKLDKDSLIYKIMIRQPSFVTNELALDIIETVKKKKPNPLLNEAKFESIEDGQSVQILHIGSYDDEPLSFANMKEYCDNNNLVRTSMTHREIYLSDPRKTSPDKLKTVLRFKV